MPEPLEEADGARSEAGVPAVGEPAETPAVAPRPLATGPAGGDRADGPPPALGESDFRALMLQWGYSQVDEGQEDERGLTNQCYFVALREACSVGRLMWPAADLRQNILDLLDTPHWVDHYESQKCGPVLVGQGPPGSALRAGQAEATWRGHLGRPGAYGLGVH